MTKKAETPTTLTELDLDAVTGAGVCDNAYCKIEDIKGEVHSSEPATRDGKVSAHDAYMKGTDKSRFEALLQAEGEEPLPG